MKTVAGVLSQVDSYETDILDSALVAEQLEDTFPYF